MIDLQVYGSAFACRTVADGLGRLTTVAGGTFDALTGALNTVQSSWTGITADAAGARLSALRSEMATLEEQTQAVEAGLRGFADELDVVSNRMADIAGDAAAGGLIASAISVSGPQSPGEDADANAVAAYDGKAALYADLATRAAEARTLEDEAHARLITVLAAVTDDPMLIAFLKDAGFLPAGWELPGLLGFGAASVFTGVGWQSSWYTMITLGRFAPRVAGEFVPIGTGWFGNRWFGPNMIRVLNESNWVPKPYQAGAYSSWSTAGKWVGRAGVVVTFGLATYDQWQTDADDPSLSTSEKVGRAGTVGATTAAGAWAGAWAGTQVGAAIGTACGGPVGTVVGGVIGGIIGGVAGSAAGQEFGSWIADGAGQATEAVVDWVGDAADATGDWIGDAADSAGDALSDFGDALTFWD